MTVEVLVCRPDGTQALEVRELPDNWFDSGEQEETEEKEQ